MTDQINITIYYIGTILVYVILLCLILYNIYPHINSLFKTLAVKFSSLINRNPRAVNIYGKIKTSIKIPITVLKSALIKIISVLSVFFRVIESNILNAVITSISSIFDYTALLFRKSYSLKYQHSILITISVIVVFYIILTVF